MKKTILILVAIVAMVACGKSDSNGTGGGGSYSTGKFSPPAWIQGSWFKDNPSSTVMLSRQMIFAR